MAEHYTHVMFVADALTTAMQLGYAVLSMHVYFYYDLLNAILNDPLVQSTHPTVVEFVPQFAKHSPSGTINATIIKQANMGISNGCALIVIAI